MKIAILMGAALLGVAAPAAAQRYDDGGRSWQDDRGYRDDRGWRDGRDWRDDRGYRDDRHHGRGRDWNRGRYWHGGYARTRTVCRIERGYYGRQRVCYQVRR